MVILMLACNSQLVEPLPQPRSAKVPTIDQEQALQHSVASEESTGSAVLLDGQKISVSWDDGDTFKGVHPSTGKKISARLAGFNSLESYGPVHRWGEWSTEELFFLAKEAGNFAAAKQWSCTDTGKGGGYGRLLVDCPDLRREILEAGLAHSFSVGSAASEEDLEAQRVAIENKSGMWAKGVPKLLLTSLHSQDEKPNQNTYNRSCVVNTGQCDKVTHTFTYTECQLVCTPELPASCMLYVPYKRRYGADRAECLKLQ